MDKNTLSRDLLVKTFNLANYLKDEKNDTLFSAKLFDSASLLCECAYLLQSSALSKNELTSLRKDASLYWEKTVFYIESIHSAGLLSEAQKDSMLQTLTILKKETNF